MELSKKQIEEILKSEFDNNEEFNQFGSLSNFLTGVDYNPGSLLPVTLSDGRELIFVDKFNEWDGYESRIKNIVLAIDDGEDIVSFKFRGYYDSWESQDWDHNPCIVEPKTKAITVWEEV